MSSRLEGNPNQRQYLEEREEEFLSKVSKESIPYWEGLRKGALLLQRCSKCNSVVYYSRAICPKCGGSSLGWFTSSGVGKIFSYTLVHNRSSSELFKHEPPYAVILVELAEGPVIMSNLIDYDQNELRVGQKVEVSFERLGKSITLAKFKPLRTGGVTA
jgi:uncharacterized protein